MGALIVCGALALAVALCLRFEHLWKRESECLRNRENLRRRNIHRGAGNLTYPHELADGRVRWYHVDRDPDAVDL